MGSAGREVGWDGCRFGGSVYVLIKGALLLLRITGQSCFYILLMHSDVSPAGFLALSCMLLLSFLSTHLSIYLSIYYRALSSSMILLAVAYSEALLSNPFYFVHSVERNPYMCVVKLICCTLVLSLNPNSTFADRY
jgi:hypothetical protein